jgi:hypothetical protein
LRPHALTNQQPRINIVGATVGFLLIKIISDVVLIAVLIIRDLEVNIFVRKKNLKNVEKNVHKGRKSLRQDNL